MEQTLQSGHAAETPEIPHRRYHLANVEGSALPAYRTIGGRWVVRCLRGSLSGGLILVGLCSSASAEVLVSNLDERWTVPGSIGDINDVVSDPYSGPVGVFRTGTGRHLLTSVTLEHAFWKTLPVSPQFRILLFARAEVAPPGPEAQILAELQHPVVDPTPTQFPDFSQRVEYSSLDPVMLEADTTYWLGAYLPPGSPGAALMFVFSTGERGLDGWSISDFSHAGFADENGTVSWSLSSFGLSSSMLKFAVNGVAVPEPPLWSLFALGAPWVMLFSNRLRPDRRRPRSPIPSPRSA